MPDRRANRSVKLFAAEVDVVRGKDFDDAVELVPDRDAAVTRAIPARLLKHSQLRRVL
jgi:hypothetical protein